MRVLVVDDQKSVGTALANFTLADVLRAEGGDLVVPAPVSAEVDYLIRRRGSAMAARAFLRDVAAALRDLEVACDVAVCERRPDRRGRRR